jgi:hypothetical protein
MMRREENTIDHRNLLIKLAIFAKFFLTSIFGTLYDLVRTFVYNFLVVSFGSGDGSTDPPLVSLDIDPRNLTWTF